MIILELRVEIEPFDGDEETGLGNADQLRNALVSVVDTVSAHSSDNMLCTSNVYTGTLAEVDSAQ